MAKTTAFKGPLDSVGHAQRMVHKVALGFNFKKIQDPEFQFHGFRWLAEVTRGIWIVRLRARSAVDHCVVVDGRRQEIVDSEEKKPMLLSESSLRGCGGDGAADLYIAEVRELYMSTKVTQNK